MSWFKLKKKRTFVSSVKNRYTMNSIKVEKVYPRPVFKKYGNLNISFDYSPSLRFVHTQRRPYFVESSVRFCLSKSFPCIATSYDLQGAQHSNFWWSVHLNMSNCLLQSIEYPYSMSNLHQVTNCLNWFYTVMSIFCGNIVLMQKFEFSKRLD